MNIILVPSSRRGRGQPASLSHWHLTALLTALLLLSALLGVLTYRTQALLDPQGESAALSAQKKELIKQRATVFAARREAHVHLNALAQRLGSLQAQVLRLNALGSRLTRMAGLDAREFNFEQLPAMGGPERTASAGQSPEVVKSLERLSFEIDRSQERLTALESLLLDRRLNTAVTPSGWPVEGGWVSSSFGLRADPFTGHQSMHEGMDIASRLGSSILAMGDGVITWAADKVGYGLAVEITHESGLITRYAHTSVVSVKVGDRVARGQEIARVGSSGRSTGPHLHFEVVRDGRAVNPAHYLQQAGALGQVARNTR